FVARRTTAASIATLAQMLGLIAMPLIAQFAISHGGWRVGWVALGITVFVVGFFPVWLLMVRRPEDMGLAPDGATRAPPGTTDMPIAEPAFSRGQALRTSSFWLLMLFTMLIYPVQA